MPCRILKRLYLKHENHPSVPKIKENNTSNVIFQFHEIEEKDLENIFHEINPKMSTGLHQVPPKLVKLLSEYIIAPIRKAVNSSILF